MHTTNLSARRFSGEITAQAIHSLAVTPGGALAFQVFPLFYKDTSDGELQFDMHQCTFNRRRATFSQMLFKHAV
jgi:hypothetical protein